MKKFFIHLLFLSTLSLHPLTADITSRLTNSTFVECSLEPKQQVRKQEQNIKGIYKGRTMPQMAVEESSSTNWCGYVSATNLAKPKNGSVSAISGTWTVPQLKSTPDNTYTAIWVGIDGYGSGTVEQLGTEHDWFNGKQVDYAWFEMYPNPSYLIKGFPLNNGDVIQAEVKYLGNNQFQLSIVNHTKNIYTIIPTAHTKSAVAKRSSAEWIVEAPYSSQILPLSDFQEVSFTNCTTTINGVQGGIDNIRWQVDALTMKGFGGNIKAVPSSLGQDKESFTVTWMHE